MNAEGDFPGVGERLVAALSSFRKGIGIEYELKANRSRGCKVPPIFDELGMELIFLIFDDARANELEQLISQLRNVRTSPKKPVDPDLPVQ